MSSSPIQPAPATSLPKRLWQTFKRVVRIRYRYWRKFEISGEVEGWRFIWRIWKIGPVARLGLLAVVIATVIAATQIEAQAIHAIGAEVSVPASITLLSVTIFAIGWAFALTAASRWSLAGYFIVCAYLAWYGLLIGGSLAGTPPFALPTLWMLLLGWRNARASKGRWRAWLLIMCLGAGYLTYGAFGLRRIFTADWEIAAPITLGAIYFVALINRFTLKRFPKTDQPIKPDRVFGSTLIVIGLFFVLALTRNQGLVADNTLLAMRGLLGVIDLFWLWLGAGLFEGAIGLGQWLTIESTQLITPRFSRSMWPLIWIAVAVFGWLATHAVPFSVTVFAHNIGLTEWVKSWGNPDYWSVYYQVFVGLIALAIWLVFIIRRRGTNDRLAWLTGVWLAAYIGIVGYFTNLETFGTLKSNAATALTFYAGLTLIVGLIWTLVKSNADWSKVSAARVYALIAFLLMMLSLSAITLGAGLPELMVEHSLYSFFGVIYLGVPLAAYGLITKHTQAQPLSMWKLLALFAIGALSASLVLGIDPNAGWHMSIAPLVWLLVLFVWGQPLARLSSALDGLIAGGVIALGFVTFWMFPQILPIPFFSLWQQWQDRYMLVPLNRPLLQAGQWWLTLIALGLGMLIGWALTLRERTGLKIAVGLSAAVIFAIALPRLPGLAIDPASSIAAVPPSIAPTPNPLWNERQLGNTTYRIDVPPDWAANPRGDQGLLINLFTPDGRALFSVTLFEGQTDAEVLARNGSEVWLNVLPDYTVTREPAWRTLAAQQVLWLEWSSEKNGSRGLDAYLVIKPGTLRFSLLSEPNAIGLWQSVFEQVISSLRN
jgi:hypothetical protein